MLTFDVMFTKIKDIEWEKINDSWYEGTIDGGASSAFGIVKIADNEWRLLDYLVTGEGVDNRKTLRAAKMLAKRVLKARVENLKRQLNYLVVSD